MTPDFEQQQGGQIGEIIHLLHKLNRKVQRLLDQSGQDDFSKEDAQISKMAQAVREETDKLQPRVPP